MIQSPFQSSYPNCSKQSRGLFTAGLLALSLLATSGAQAASGTWVGATDNNWITPGNWSVSPAPGATSGAASTDIATFDSNPANRAIVIDSGRNIKSILFDTINAGAYTIGSTGGNALTLTSGGSITMNSSVTAAQAVNAPLVIGSTTGATYSFINNAASPVATLSIGGPVTTAGSSGTNTLTLGGSNAGNNVVSGVISNAPGGAVTALTKLGTGTWTLSGANTYTGVTTIGSAGGTTGGTLKLSGSAVITDPTIYAGTLDLNGTTQTGIGITMGLGGQGTMSAIKLGTGNLRIGSSVSNGAITYSNGSLTGGATISSASGGSMTFKNRVNLVVGDSINAPIDLLISTNINEDAAGRILAASGGAGFLKLTGTNTYTGRSQVSSGTLEFGQRVSLYNANTSKWSDSNNFLVQGSGATMAFNVGGTGEFTASDIAILAPVVNWGNNYTGGYFGLDTTNAGGNFTYGGVFADHDATHTMGVSKLGAGSLTLTGASTYTVGTVINQGTLILDRNQGGSLAATSPLQIKGGAFQFKGANGTASTQTLGNLTIGGGNQYIPSTELNRIIVTPGASGGTASLTLGNTWTNGAAASQGNALNIDLTANGATLFSSPTLTNGLIGESVGGAAYVTVTDSGGTGFATQGSGATTGQVVRYTGATTLTAGAGSSTTNYITSGNITETGSAAVNTLHLDTSISSGSLNLGNGNTFTLTGAALLMTGSHDFTILGTNSNLFSGAGKEMLIHQYGTGVLTISADTYFNFGGGWNFTKDGTGEVVINSKYAFNTNVNVLAGQLTVATNGLLNIPSSQPYRGVTVADGAAIALSDANGAITSVESFNLYGAGLAANPQGALRNLTGNNTISGAVYLGSDSTIQSDAGTLTLSGNVAGRSNLTLTGSGNGLVNSAINLTTAGVTKAGSGTWTLSGVNTYSGGTRVSAGTLILSGSGTYGTGTIATSGGTLDLGGNSITNALGALTGGGVVANGTITNDASAYDLQSGTVSAVLAGSNGLSKTTSGTVILSGANTYSGGTSVSNGTLTLSGSGTYGTGTIATSGGTLDLGGKSITNTLGALTGGGVVSNGTITNNSSNYDVQSGTVSAVLSGSNGLNKSGSGTVTLGGANDYVGTTTVTLGTLVIDHATALGSGDVSVTAGAVLTNNVGAGYNFAGNVRNNGTVNTGGSTLTIGVGDTLSGTGNLGGGGIVKVEGFLAPGNSPGTQTVEAFTTLEMGNGATFIWQLNNYVDNDSGAPGVDWDSLAMAALSSNITLNGTLQISLDGINFSSTPYWESNHTYTFVTGLAGTLTGDFTSITGDYTYTNANGTGTFARSGKDITYTWAAVPEPSTWALMAFSLTVVLVCGRRRKRL